MVECTFFYLEYPAPIFNITTLTLNISIYPTSILHSCQERQPWLKSLHYLISGWWDDQASPTCSKGGVVGVLACSALKKSYRDLLRGESQANSATVKRCIFVLLRASEQELWKRVGSRKSHFMPTSLIQSQLSTLEYPDKEEKLTVTIETDGCGVDDIVMKIIDTLKHMDITT